jgi:hypothetical protein
MRFVHRRIKELDRLSNRRPLHCQDTRHIQNVLGRQDHAGQLDGNPRKIARLRDGRGHQRQHSGVVGRVNC